MANRRSLRIRKQIVNPNFVNSGVIDKIVENEENSLEEEFIRSKKGHLHRLNV